MNKKNIILSLIFSVISFSYVNSNLSTTDNVGYVAVACYSSSNGMTNAGYTTMGNIAAASFLGCATKAGLAIVAGTTPVGWIIGGVVCAA